MKNRKLAEATTGGILKEVRSLIQLIEKTNDRRNRPAIAELRRIEGNVTLLERGADLAQLVRSAKALGPVVALMQSSLRSEKSPSGAALAQLLSPTDFRKCCGRLEQLARIENSLLAQQRQLAKARNSKNAKLRQRASDVATWRAMYILKLRQLARFDTQLYAGALATALEYELYVTIKTPAANNRRPRRLLTSVASG